MSDKIAIDERQIHEATQDIINRVIGFDDETRRRVFRTALTFYGLESPPAIVGQQHSQGEKSNSAFHDQPPTIGRAPSFTDRSELPAKEFMFQKQPRTDIDRVACLAYYLAHYRDTRQFKTIDLSQLNTEAAQIKFSNTAFAVANATNAGLLVPAGKGFKQISALGERYVEALPDRNAAKEILSSVRSPRNRRSSKSKSNSN